MFFNSAVNQNMFHHSGISKRNKYIFNNEEGFNKWLIMNDLLEKLELEVFPLKLSYIKNMIYNYFRRWRENTCIYSGFYSIEKRI